MLDKTILYKDIIMKARKDIASHQQITELPKGYQYHMYQEGDEIGWARLETSVGEFECFEDAMCYFHRVFMPYKEALHERMCFIIDKENKIVSTTTAWFKEDNTRRYALLHWVSTSPNEQGKGLASAIVKYALSKFIEMEPMQEDIFLHTQTWSYKAISLYYKYGFRITKTPLLEEITDLECIPLLEKKLPKEMMIDLVID